VTKKRVQLTLDEKTVEYLDSLVESGEAASRSHAVRKIIKRRMKEEKRL
jgi:Arc/MetJ-type ribon-helix-helix transcriptional regulator